MVALVYFVLVSHDVKPAHRVLGLALLLAGIAFTSSGCVFVPVGRAYGYRPAYVVPAPIVLAPAPVVVVRRPYLYW